MNGTHSPTARIGASVFLIGLLASARSAEAAAEQQTYTVVAGDTCIGVARKLWGDPRKVQVLHRYNPLGPTPHHLRPGQVLVIAPGAAPERLAKVSLVVNHVLEFTPDQHPGRVPDPLRGGDRVSTGERSFAELTFADLTKLRLGSDSLMVVAPPSTRTDAAGTSPHLMSGALRAFVDRLGPGGGDQLLLTNGARLGIGRGEALVRVNAEDATSLSVYRGRSRVRSARKEVTVVEGYGTRARKGAPPEKPRPLPATPSWTEGAAVAVWARVGASTEVKLAPSVAAADRARVVSFHAELASDADFKAPRDEQTHPAEQPIVFELGPGEQGFVRVSALDEADLESRVSPPLRIVAVQSPELASRSDGADWVALPPGTICNLDGAEVHGVEVALEPGRAHRLACATADGIALPALDYAARPAAVVPPAAVEAPPPAVVVAAPPPRPTTKRVAYIVTAGGGARIDPRSGDVTSFVRAGIDVLVPGIRVGALGVGGRVFVDPDRAGSRPMDARAPLGLGFAASLVYFTRPLERVVVPFVGLSVGGSAWIGPRSGETSLGPVLEPVLGVDLALGGADGPRPRLRLTGGYRQAFVGDLAKSIGSGFLLGAELGLE